MPSEILSQLLRVFVFSSVFILTAKLVFKMLPQASPSVRAWVWRAIFLYLVAMPFWNLSLRSPVEFAVLPPVDVGAFTEPADAVPAGVVNTLTAQTVNVHSSSIDWKIWVVALWVLSLCMFLGFVAREVFRFRKRALRFEACGSKRVRSLFLDLLEEWEGSPTPRLRVSNEDQSPFLYGVYNPIVVVPKKALSFSDTELKLVFGHELAHLKYNHLAWSWLAMAGIGMFWFNPLVWIARRELRLSQELEADESALAQCNRQTKLYGGALLKVILKNDKNVSNSIVAVHMGESFELLKRRILEMKNIRPLSRRSKRALILVLVVAAVIGLAPWKTVPIADAGSGSKPFSKACETLVDCAQYVSELTGEKYLYTELKGKVESSGNIKLTKENAVLLFTNALYANGYTRVPLAEKNTYKIDKLREARDTLLPEYKATKKSPPPVPDNWDLAKMTYTAEHPEVVEHMARTIRAFMPRQSRIIPIEISGQVIVTASSPDIKNAYNILREMDVKPSKALSRKWEARAKRRREERRAEVRKLGPTNMNVKKAKKKGS